MDIIRNVSTALQEQLGDELDEIARECNVVQREREFTGRTWADRKKGLTCSESSSRFGIG